MPFMSSILLSHDKAPYVAEALDSLLAQTFTDWEVVLIDSGVLFDRGYFDTLQSARDPRVRVVRSGETEELRKTKTIASWCFNECFRRGLIRGEYVTYLCDDDILYPNAFQAFHDYARAHPDAVSMYAGIDRAGVPLSGKIFYFPPLRVEEVKGSCCGGGPLDCHVDSLQLCHKVDLLKRFPDDEFWPEDRAVIRHADGIFLERIGALVPVYPVKVTIGQNRKVPLSLNDGGERLEYWGRLYHLLEEKEALHRLWAETGTQEPGSVERMRRLEDGVADYQRALEVDGENAGQLDKLFRLIEEGSRSRRALAEATAEADSLREQLGALRAENGELRQALAGAEVPAGAGKAMRYRIADKVNRVLRRLPALHRGGKGLLVGGWKFWGGAGKAG